MMEKQDKEERRARRSAGIVLGMLAVVGAIAICCALLLAVAKPVDAAPVYPPRNGDPCAINLRTPKPISLAAGAKVITGVAGKQIYICHIALVSGTAQNVALVEGTGSTCATGITGMAGGSTAATGWNFAANTGIVEGVGSAWVQATATAGDDVCLLSSSTGQISGVIDYAQQ